MCATRASERLPVIFFQPFAHIHTHEPSLDDKEMICSQNIASVADAFDRLFLIKPNMTDEEIQTLYDKSMDGFAYEKFVGEMEEYGIHDFFGTDEILHGFDSSEIDPKRYLSVVKKWQRYFTNVVGLKTGPIYKIDGKIEYL